MAGYQNKLLCLGRGLRKGKQAPVWGRLRPPAKFGRVQDKSLSFLVPGKLPCLGRGLREGKQAPVWGHAICARVNRRLFEALQSARE